MTPNDILGLVLIVILAVFAVVRLIQMSGENHG
jgi:hypothetical protein